MANTNFLNNKLVEAVIGRASYLSTGYYVGVSTTTPTAAGGNVTEPAIGTAGYARVLVSEAEFGTATNGVISNIVEQQFPQSTGVWLAGANLTHFVVYDAATGGNLLHYNVIPGTPQGVVENTVLVLPIDGIQITSV